MQLLVWEKRKTPSETGWWWLGDYFDDSVSWLLHLIPLFWAQAASGLSEKEHLAFSLLLCACDVSTESKQDSFILLWIGLLFQLKWHLLINLSGASIKPSSNSCYYCIMMLNTGLSSKPFYLCRFLQVAEMSSPFCGLVFDMSALT